MAGVKEILKEARDRVEHYKKLGVNPLALATGCAVKVDLERVVYPALTRIRSELAGSKLEIAPREDADVIKTPKSGIRLERRIYELEKPESMRVDDVKGFDGSHVIVLIQVHQRYAFDADSFYSRISPFYRLMAEAGRFYIGKGHSIVTPFEGDEFILFDFVAPVEGEPEGYTAVNNDTIHIIDPTSDPGDYRQVAGAINNSLNDLYVMGATEDLAIAPVINAPSDAVREKLETNLARYAEDAGARLLKVESPKRGRLLLGATVSAFTDRVPPTFYDRVRKGAKLILTRPIGELAPINVFLAAVMDERVVDDLEKYGIPGDDLLGAKEEAFNTIATSNREAGRIIAKYLPRYGEEFRPDEHIYATIDVTGPGIYVVWELALNARTHIRLYEIPLLFPEFSRYATDRYLMLNSTAGTNGAFVILAPEETATDIVDELRKSGYPARIIGEVVDVGGPRVDAPKVLAEYVADKRILDKFQLY